MNIQQLWALKITESLKVSILNIYSLIYLLYYNSNLQ